MENLEWINDLTRLPESSKNQSVKEVLAELADTMPNCWLGWKEGEVGAAVLVNSETKQKEYVTFLSTGSAQGDEVLLYKQFGEGTSIRFHCLESILSLTGQAVKLF